MLGNIAKGLFEAAFAALAGRVITMLKIEVENAKEEVQAKLKALLAGAILLLIAGVIGAFAAGALLVSGISALSTVWPLWLSTLVVGGGAALIGLILCLIGLSLVKKNKDLRPQRAMDNIRSLLGQSDHKA